jgi:predicted enzyme related to lactoylglutathione lyase
MSHGKICYLEIPARTGEESAEFYSSIFGWKVRERGDGNLASTTQAASAARG